MRCASVGCVLFHAFGHPDQVDVKRHQKPANRMIYRLFAFEVF